MPQNLRKQDTIAGRYIIENEIDDIKGSIARVYAAKDLQNNEEQSDFAFKILRHEHLSLSEEKLKEKYEAFNREAELLYLLRDNPHVMEMYGVGYLRKASNNSSEPYQVVKDLLVENLNEATIEQFRTLQSEAMAKGWRPYLVLKRYPQHNSLHYLLRKKGRSIRLPMIEAIELSLQLAELLVELHHQNIIYWDAKPAHAYWDGQNLVLIDWNISYLLTPENIKRTGGGSPTDLKELDILILGRRFIYPAFIGRDFRGQPLESQATPYGSMVREMHAFFYQGEVSLYGYEDKLDAPVREFLSRVVQSHQFNSAQQLHTSLQRCAAQLGWSFEDELTNEQMVHYHEKKKKVIANLRLAHQAIAEAWWDIRELRKEFPGEDTKYLFHHIRELFKRSEIP